MVERINDETYMRTALQLAASASGQTGINPVVGCVVVRGGRIIGLGAHLERGSAHAEVHALDMAAGQAEGATVYVTLEPCSHHGRTPPCCDRLIAERVARVVVAAADPNPLVAGRGIARLREAGIAVDVGLLEAESVALNEAFNKYIRTRLPFITLKSAVTLDGKIATRTGDSRWVTGAEARAAVHALRHRHQGIMVGVGTVIADDPQLTTRLTVPGLHPTRIIVDSRLRLPESANVLHDGTAPTIVVTTTESPPERRERLAALGVAVLVCGDGPRVDLAEALRRLGELEIGSILLEGGGTLNGAMLEAGLVDKVVQFIALKVIGGGSRAPGAFEFTGFSRMAEAIRLDRVTVEQAGDDVCITGYPQYERSDSACSPD